MKKGGVKQPINDQLKKFIKDVEMEMETTEDNEYIIQCAKNELKENR
jgi:hypothetical protein